MKKRTVELYRTYVELVIGERDYQGFTRTEKKEMLKDFRFCIKNGIPGIYVESISEEIRLTKPSGIYGYYDLETIRELENLRTELLSV